MQMPVVIDPMNMLRRERELDVQEVPLRNPLVSMFRANEFLSGEKQWSETNLNEPLDEQRS